MAMILRSLKTVKRSAIRKIPKSKPWTLLATSGCINQLAL